MHPSSRAVNSARELGPWTQVVETDLYRLSVRTNVGLNVRFWHYRYKLSIFVAPCNEVAKYFYTSAHLQYMWQKAVVKTDYPSSNNLLNPHQSAYSLTVNTIPLKRLSLTFTPSHQCYRFTKTFLSLSICSFWYHWSQYFNHSSFILVWYSWFRSQLV